MITSLVHQMSPADCYFSVTTVVVFLLLYKRNKCILYLKVSQTLLTKLVLIHPISNRTINQPCGGCGADAQFSKISYNHDPMVFECVNLHTIACILGAIYTVLFVHNVEHLISSQPTRPIQH